MDGTESLVGRALVKFIAVSAFVQTIQSIKLGLLSEGTERINAYKLAEITLGSCKITVVVVAQAPVILYSVILRGAICGNGQRFEEFSCL